MANVNFKDRKRSELVLEAGDSSNVTLVCGDGSLTFPSFRLLGMCSPVVRSSNNQEGEEVVIILPDFFKSTVSTVLEVVSMNWEGEKAISASEKGLLESLGVTTGALLADIKRGGAEERKELKQDVKAESGETRRDGGMKNSVKVKQKNNANFNKGKKLQSLSVPQKEQNIIETKLKKTHSEINLAIASSKAKQMDYFLCDLCDEKVEKRDLKTHLNKEHQEDIGAPSDSEIQSYFKPSPTVGCSTTSSASMPEAKKSSSERDKYSISPPTMHPEDETSKIAERYGLGLAVSIVARGEKAGDQKEQAGIQNRKPSIQNSQGGVQNKKSGNQTSHGGVQNKHPPKSITVPLHTAVPRQSEKIRVVAKVKSEGEGVKLAATIAKPALPPQLTKKLPSPGFPVKKELDKPKISEPMNDKSLEKTNNFDLDQTNKDMQKKMSTSNVEGKSKDMLVKCPQCKLNFGGNSSTVKFELRSHIGLTHYNTELMIEVERMFVENKCVGCDKMFKSKEQQQIHLLYNHTRWVELVSLEADNAMEKRDSDPEKNKKSEGIKLVPTLKLLSPQAKRAKEERKEDKDQSEVKKGEEVKNMDLETKVRKVVGKCIHCEKHFSGNDPDEISIHFLVSHTTANDSYFLASNQCFVCDVAVLPEHQNLHMMKMHDYMKSEIQSFILQVVKNASTSNIGIKDELIKSEVVVPKVDTLLDRLGERTPPGRKAPDSIADIQRKLLAIVGTQAVKDIDDDPDFEEVVDDEEDAVEDIIANDLGEENTGEETNEEDITGVQAELIKMRNISIKMQNISDDEEEEDDRMDTLEDVLNFKEEEADGDLEEVYKDISDDEYCGEDDEIEREISLMKEEGGNTDMSELEELVQPSL